MSLDRVLSKIDELRDYAVSVLCDLIRIPAVNPSYGGQGEWRRAEYLERLLREIGVDEIRRYDVPDERVPEGKRPNLVAFIKGESERRLWIIAHMDTVPEGDRSLWRTDPFEPKIEDGKIYGRGAEDNGQAIASALTLARALIETGVRPKFTLALAFVADEEAGSRYGLKYLVERGIFRKDDLIVVPDFGTPKGDFIEIAEKSVLWLKITVIGKQAHASTPHLGVNAHRIGMRFALTLDEMLHAKYSERDPLFDPPESTFEPTRKEENVANVNTLPGRDVIYFDCRILPKYDLDEILEFIDSVRRAFEKAYGVKIEVEPVAKSQAPPATPPDSEVVVRLKEAIRRVRGFEPRVGGIGGGTVAAILRRAGLHAAVWATLDDTAHQANEYARIENIVGDAKVFAAMALL